MSRKRKKRSRKNKRNGAIADYMSQLGEDNELYKLISITRRALKKDFEEHYVASDPTDSAEDIIIDRAIAFSVTSVITTLEQIESKSIDIATKKNNLERIYRLVTNKKYNWDEL